MALFGKKKEKNPNPSDGQEKKEASVVEEAKAVKKVVKKTTAKKAPVSATAKKVKKTDKVFNKDLSWVLKKPRITEKSTILPETSNAYVFEVSPKANKTDVKAAISEKYKVDPVKVNIMPIPTKKVSRRRSRGSVLGTKGGGKKAYVFLKKGDKIEFV